MTIQTSSRPETVQSSPELVDLVSACPCPACGHQVAVPFYEGGAQPLATLAWPRSAEEARSMKRLPLAFRRCVECGHVYNTAFDYKEVPYSQNPNRMFNRGRLWQEHLCRVRNLIVERLPPYPTVIEIGCGDGHFLQALAQAGPAGYYIGFDPNSAAGTATHQVEIHRTLFDPLTHLAEYRPDMIISRHVLEHLMNPLGFMQLLAFAASWHEVEADLFLEVPCIDRVFETGRTTDFYYEHNSHFTTTSFTHLLQRCADVVELVERGYNDEVIYGLARIGVHPAQARCAREAIAFRNQALAMRTTIRQTLEQYIAAGKTIAIWGGTGKAAALINSLGLDADRFPLVVDSDPEKVGTFVPGTGQEIRFRDHLLLQPADIILIATQWRAQDIVLEIEQHHIPYQQILLEYRGRLVDYFADEHPYKLSASRALCNEKGSHHGHHRNRV
ncbi:MAG: methyltransferase domain-containing protein [Nitrospinota bacterium]|nr:MAG: methyltransferase domain-containing protein [Nitrospinota bacterium]